MPHVFRRYKIHTVQHTPLVSNEGGEHTETYLQQTQPSGTARKLRFQCLEVVHNRVVFATMVSASIKINKT